MIHMKNKFIISGLVILLLLLTISPIVYGASIIGPSLNSNDKPDQLTIQEPAATIPPSSTKTPISNSEGSHENVPTSEGSPSSPTTSEPEPTPTIPPAANTEPAISPTVIPTADFTGTTSTKILSFMPKILNILEKILPQLYISAPTPVTEGTMFTAFVYTINDDNITIPVPNAAVSVSWNKRLYHTDSNGFVLLTAPPVDEPTNHTIRAWKTGYGSAIFSIIVIPANGWIYGTVYDDNTSLPLANAEVCAVSQGDNSSQCVFTNVSGHYTMQVLPGEYSVTASKEGYLRSSPVNITVPENTAVEVNFWLEFVQLPPPSRVFIDDDFNENTPGWGYDHFSTIQAGINAVAVGGVVSIGSGTYLGSILINKMLWLSGDPETVIIDGNHQGHVVTVTANNSMIDGCTIQNGGSYRTGILIDHADAVYVIDTIVQDCTWGIALEHSTYDVIGENIVRDCSQIGILVEYSSHNLIAQNNVQNCGMTGIHLVHQATNNTIYHNNFIENEQSAFSAGYNLWDNGYPLGGNYWSDFDEPNEGAYDNNSDGIVDTPYIIPSGSSRDRYPLVHMFGVDYLEINTTSEVLEGEEFTVRITCNGESVRGALVTWIDMTYVTDYYGQVTLVAPNVTQTSTFLLTANKTGYYDASTTVTVLNHNSSLQIEAPAVVWEKSWFTVHVTSDGIPVSNAQVSWLDFGTSFYTGSDGAALVQAPTIYNSTNFTYDTLIAEKTGYLPDSQSVFIWNNKNLHLDTPTVVDEDKWFMVTVTDEGLPIANARVFWEISGISFYTGPNGTALVQALSVPPGSNVTHDWLIAEKQGYSSYAVYITICKNASRLLEIHSPDSVYESTYFTVYITADTTPIPNATIRFMNQTYITNSNGSADVFANGVLYDKYELLTVSKSGYENSSKQILVLNKKLMQVTGPDEIYENEWFTIHVSSDGQPIANASIHWFDYPYWTFTTDANGSARILAHSVDGDLAFIYDYLVVSKDGFWDGGKVIKILNYIPLNIEAPAEVYEGTYFTITVTANGTHIAGASIQFMNRTYTTNENGSVTMFALGVLHDQIELITATKSGYENGYKYILIKNKETLTIHAPENVTEREWFTVTVTSSNSTVSNVTLTWTNYGSVFTTDENGTALVQAPPLFITNSTNGSVNYSGWDCLQAEKDGYWSAYVCLTIYLRLGDMNLDGDVNFGDINAFVLGMTNRDAYIDSYGQPPEPRGDINQDGVFNFADIDPFVALLSD
jgi:parallel beta-helix repeat protein